MENEDVEEFFAKACDAGDLKMARAVLEARPYMDYKTPMEKLKD